MSAPSIGCAKIAFGDPGGKIRCGGWGGFWGNERGSLVGLKVCDLLRRVFRKVRHEGGICVVLHAHAPGQVVGVGGVCARIRGLWRIINIMLNLLCNVINGLAFLSRIHARI